MKLGYDYETSVRFTLRLGIREKDNLNFSRGGVVQRGGVVVSRGC